MDNEHASGPDAARFGGAVGPTRQQRSARTRERILDAAQEAFVEDGIAAVSLRDVAARAGVTHPGVLRHYASREALLGAVVERLDDANAAWLEGLTESDDSLGATALARRNAASPDYLVLFTALSGEATSAAHPAHGLMRSRYARVREAIAARLRERGDRSDDEALQSATLLIAGWDGLQVQQRYAPGIDLVEMLAERERLALAAAGSPGGTRAQGAQGAGVRGDADRTPDRSIDPAATGPRSAARRAEIVAAATRLFAAEGFTGTSLSRIAERVGISKATLLHHVGSKDELLIEVLRRRDLAASQHDATADGRAHGGEARRGAARLRTFPDIADRTTAEDPGLVELYAVLSCEATTPVHPAHAYFAHRFETMRRSFAELFEQARTDGDLAGDRDPGREAAWLLAVWDGLQIQSLYDPRIEVGPLLRAHLERTLAPA
ncbi:TetR/AcrR family transcriptional regulator [Agromyces soli]